MEPLAVAVLGQLAAELVDEQAAVREDQDAFGARGLDEAGSGDRLAGRGRVAEAVAAHRAGVGLDRQRLLDLLVRVGLCLGLELVLCLVVLVGGSSWPLPFPFSLFWAAAISSVSMPGERVDLVAAQLRAGGEMRRPFGEDSLEAEQQRVAHLPLGRRRRTARVQLVERVVERPAAGGSGREDDVRIVIGTQEGLAGP